MKKTTVAKKTAKANIPKTSQIVQFGDVEVSKVFYQSENIARFSIDVVDVTAKNNNVHTFVTCVWFHPSIKVTEGNILPLLTGELCNDSYTDKYGNTQYRLCVRVVENIKSEE